MLFCTFEIMTKPLRIGFDAKRAFQNKTGLGSYSRTTIDALVAAFPDNDYQLYTPGIKEGLYQAPEQCTISCPDGRWWTGVKPVWRSYKVTELAQRAGVELFHGLSHDLPVGLAKAGIRSVVTFHDLIMMRYPRFYRAADRRLYYQKNKHALRVADRIIAISEQTRHDLQEFMGVDDSRISVLYQSINPLFYTKARPDDLEFTRLKYRLPRHFVLLPGTLEPRKNQGRILQALVENRIDIPVVIAGRQTSYLKKLKPLLRQLKDRLVFIQTASNEEMAHLYQMAEMCLFVSLFEGFGLPVAEAQASGCPVITSQISSMPEAGGKGACYVDPESAGEIAAAMLLLLGDSDKRNELVELGYENAERFRAEAYAQQLMEIYQTIG